jgi:uncharacterized protein (TIGR03437 family)
MRIRFQQIAWGLAIALALPAASLAKNVFVLPGGAPSQEVHVFSDALASLGSFTGAAGPSFKVVSNPAGSRYYAFAQSGSDTLLVVDQNLARLLNFSPGSNGQAGAITPDGRRILLLTAAGLYIYDADTLARLRGPIDVGDTPIDVAASIDSRYAFTLSSNSRRLTRIDLSTNSVAGELTIPGVSTAVTAAPNGMLYVGASNRLYEIDGFTMTRRGEIAVNGTPARPSFTPDGRYAVALNTVTFTNSPTFWLFDLDARSATATTVAVTFSNILVASNSRAILLSNDRRLYQLSIPGSSLSSLTVFGVGQPIEVAALTVSDEAPAARYLYYLSTLGLHRVDLSTGRPNPDAPIGIAGSPIGLSFAGAAATGSPSQLILYNQSHSISVGGTFRPLVVRAVDSSGRPLHNVPVTFSTAVSGIALSATSATTNADGLAMTRVDPGSFTGQFTITVQAGSLSGTFTLGVGTGTGPGPSAALQIKSGNGQVVREFGIADPMVVVMRDQAGNPVPNVTITWELAEGIGSLQTVESITDSQGEASAQFIGAAVSPGLSFQQARVRAYTSSESVNFYITTVISNLPGTTIPAPLPLAILVRPEQGQTEITGRAGETLAEAIEVRIVTQAGIQFGQPIPNVGLTVGTGNIPGVGVTASCVGGTTVLSDENGAAKCDLRLGGVVGSATLLANVGGLLQQFAGIAQYTFNLTVMPGLPAVVNKLQGDNQSGRPGQQLPLALLVEVTDVSGNRLSGSPVQWSVSPAGGATLSSVITRTDIRGRASALATLGQTPGQVQVTVTSGTASTTFTLNVEVAATQLRQVSGNNQTAVVNQAFGAPLVVQLLDAQNQGVPNAVVSFAVSSGSATLSSTTATTDSQGNAQVSVRAGASAGPIVVTASFGNLPSVTFNLASRLPGPSLTVNSFTNAASGQPGLVPGSIVKIVAAGVAPGVVQNCVIPEARLGALPLSLSNVTVQFQSGGASLFGPIYYVCNMNGEESVASQVPFDLPLGSATVTVQAGGGSASISGVPVLAAQPGIFETVGSNALRHGVLMRPNGTFVSQENPARRGETIYMFATGLGAITPAAATNAAGLGETVSVQVIVGVNNEGVRVLRAEYAVNMIGVYVVAFEVPANTTPGPNRPLALAVVQAGQLVFGNGSSIPIQ